MPFTYTLGFRLVCLGFVELPIVELPIVELPIVELPIAGLAIVELLIVELMGQPGIVSILSRWKSARKPSPDQP